MVSVEANPACYDNAFCCTELIKVKSTLVTTVMRPAMAIRAQPNDFSRMIRAIVCQTLHVMGFDWRSLSQRSFEGQMVRRDCTRMLF